MATIYLPTLAEYRNDLLKSYEFFQFLPEHFQKGLMFVLRNGLNGVSGNVKELQYKNFEELTKKSGVMPVIVMASNLPLSDLNFYSIPEKSFEHIKAVIDFTYDIPGRSENPIVSFHLNTLFKPEEWLMESNNFDINFKTKILPILHDLALYASKKKISLRIETTPVPEFGDLSDKNLNELANPYSIYSGRGMQEIRNEGLGIVLDLCHTFTLYKAIELNENPKELSDDDIVYLKNHTFINEIDSLKVGDVVHLNDSKDFFLPNLNLLHKEGLVLGEGEIKNLDKIIKKISSEDLHLVFEVFEEDYLTRPNLKQSINFFNKYAN